MDQKIEKLEKLQTFSFFTRTPFTDKNPPGITLPSLNSMEVSSFVVLGSRVYVASKKKNCVFVLELITEGSQSFKSIGLFTPYSERLDFIEKCSVNGPQGKQHFLITYGLDANEQEIKSTNLKIWNHDDNSNTSDFDSIKPIKSILVGKISAPFNDYTGFALSQDLSAFAFGTKDGVLIYKCRNLLSDNPKESIMIVEKTPIKYLAFHHDAGINNVGLYVGTSSAVWSFPNISKDAKKRLVQLSTQESFKLFDVSQKGELYCVTNTNSIILCNLQEKTNSWASDEDKTMIKAFGQSYLVAAIKVKREEEVIGTRLIIYDLANLVFAYNPSTDIFANISDIFVADNGQIYTIVINTKQEKIFYKLVEEENAKKLEKILTKNCFDIAYRFAANQQYEPTLLAEISLCNANHHYTKKNYQKAIEEYKKTAGTIEPSYVIMKFLDVSQIDYLIQYLEHIHKGGLANKDHTALLLNCYVKQKNMAKFEEFLNHITNLSSDIFDTQAAVKECRDLKHTDLALKLASQCEHEDLCIRILIEDKKDYSQALEQIKLAKSLENKIRYVREYGQVLMKNQPEQALDLIKNMVVLSSFRRLKFSAERSLNHDEAIIFANLGIPESDKDRLSMIAFPRPDEFFHFFVGQNAYLEKYLDFLKNLKNLASEKNEKQLYPIFHKMFEYHLEQYTDYEKKNKEVFKFRSIADETLIRLKKNILDLLEDHETEKKYDKNHILVLFKMYQFGPGVIYLCERMNLREELLEYYIEAGDFQHILNLCKEHGEREINLWVQALKYFSKLDQEKRTFTNERGETHSVITEALTYIQRIDSLSPLLVLNIIGKTQKLSLGEVKAYFKKKLGENTMDTLRSFTMVREHNETTEKNRAEYKKLKTQAKIFQSESCTGCGDKILLHENEASVFFMCGHSYHQSCLNETDKSHYECLKCAPDLSTRAEIVEDLKVKANNSTQFFEKLENNKNKFDVISEYMGKGLFGTFDTEDGEDTFDDR